MIYWDVFHSSRLEAERSLTTEDVRAALARGELGEDDLIRPAGSTSWVPIADSPEFADLGAPSVPPAPQEPPSFDVVEDDDDEEEPERPDPLPIASPTLPDGPTGRPGLPELDESEADFETDFEPEDFDPQDEDEEAAEFTLSRRSSDRVEELDLAAMVDVAFQLVLFFLVTAQVVVFKTLEVPRPNEDKPPEAAAQGRSKSIKELEEDYILVEVDAAGALKVDRQPVPADRAALAERLRAARKATGRKAMLLSADFATRHENAVLAFDVANEVELSIAIAQPAAKK